MPLSDDLYVRRDKGRIVDEIVISLNVWSRFLDKVYRDEIVKIANQLGSGRKRYVVHVSRFRLRPSTCRLWTVLSLLCRRRQRVCGAFPQTEFIIPPGTEVEAAHREHSRHAVKIEAYVAISFDTLGCEKHRRS